MAKWDAIIAINLSGVFHGMRTAIPGMKQKGWGRIINIASAHGLVGSAHKVAYVAAKHGVLGMTKVAAIELANDGITVNAICPGWVLTPLVQKQLEDRAKAERHDGREGNPCLRDREAADGAVLHARADRRAGGVPVLRTSAKTITGTPLSRSTAAGSRADGTLRAEAARFTAMMLRSAELKRRIATELADRCWPSSMPARPPTAAAAS